MAPPVQATYGIKLEQDQPTADVRENVKVLNCGLAVEGLFSSHLNWLIE